jgi:outer membrane lipoprotein carrier protein
MKKRISRLLSMGGVAAVALLAQGHPSAFLAGQDDQALSLMRDASARYRQVDVFCARFHQELVVPLLRETTHSSGTLCQARPNLFAMRFTDPAGDVVVADGDSFWVYYPSSDPRQVLQFAMEVRPGGLDFHREFLEAPEEKYTLSCLGEEAFRDQRAHVIQAHPLGDSGFREARIWLDSERALILQARIEMENGSVRTVSLSDIRLNPPPDPDRFTFVPPAGAQVIRRR